MCRRIVRLVLWKSEHYGIASIIHNKDFKAFIINIGTVYYCRCNLYKSRILSSCIAQSIRTAETKCLYRCVVI